MVAARAWGEGRMGSFYLMLIASDGEDESSGYGSWWWLDSSVNVLSATSER